MASGDTILIFNAQSAITPSTNYAYFDLRNNHPIISFIDSTTKTVNFESVIPRYYSSNGLTVNLYWMASTATTGSVVWSVAFERLLAGTDDLDSDSFATANTVTTATNATSGVLTQSSIAFTNGAQIDSLAAGDVVRLQVSRLGANGSDTLTDIAQLFMIEIKET